MIKIRHPKLEEIARDYTEFLTDRLISDKMFSPEDKDILQGLISCKVEDLRSTDQSPQLNGAIDRHTYKAYTGSQNEYDLDGKRQRLSYWLVNQLGLTVCPYCNHNYVFTRDKDKLSGRAELDHFFPKSTSKRQKKDETDNEFLERVYGDVETKPYPHLALSFYNLIPSCPTCNHLKGSKRIGLNPYEGGFENSHLFIVENLVKLIISGEQSQVKLVKNVLYTGTQEPDPHKNIEVFRLNELYSQHGALVRDLITKAEAYHKGYYESLRDSFKELGIGSNKDLDRLVFGNYVAPEDFGKQPLSKFTRDILLQLGVDLS